MYKIRLKNPVYTTFSSYMGSTLFEKGVSVHPVGYAEAMRIAAATAVEVIDENGNAIPFGPAYNLTQNRNIPAPIEKKLVPIGETDRRAEIPTPKVDGPVEPKAPKDEADDAEADLKAQVAEIEAEEAATETAAENVKMPVYSRAELEEIADEKGITGLRSIGDGYAVKSNSIEGMIEKILTAQKA